MRSVLMTLPVFVPVVFWAWYHWHKDRHLPEPLSHLALAFGLGLVAAAISRGLYMGLEPLGLRYDAFALADTNLPGLFWYALLAIGPIEEIAKLLPFVLVVLRFREFDEPIDGIIYASFIALGYAAIENLIYLEYLTPLEAMARGFAGPVVHILFASIWGYTIACAFLDGRPVWIAASKGFLIAASIHGLYDFIVLQSALSALPIAAAIVAGIWIWRLGLMRKLQIRSRGGESTSEERARPG